jgi:hypothetical protein
VGIYDLRESEADKLIHLSMPLEGRSEIIRSRERVLVMKWMAWQCKGSGDTESDLILEQEDHPGHRIWIIYSTNPFLDLPSPMSTIPQLLETALPTMITFQFVVSLNECQGLFKTVAFLQHPGRCKSNTSSPRFAEILPSTRSVLLVN